MLWHLRIQMGRKFAQPNTKLCDYKSKTDHCDACPNPREKSALRREMFCAFLMIGQRFFHEDDVKLNGHDALAETGFL